MPYPRKLLNDYETVALDLHPHWWYFAEAVAAWVASLVLAVLLVAWDAPDALKWLALALIVASAVWFGIRYLKWSTTNFVITSHRVIYRSGVISKRGIEIPLQRINNVLSHQGPFERMIGAGDLLIESAGETGQQRFTDVRNPQRVQNLINAQMEMKERDRGGELVPPPTDVASQLEKLEGLRDRGSLTPEEFEAQKRRLLGDV
jgi:uncharacterized membrane protein YdbT with pleckstrin-like domain